MKFGIYILLAVSALSLASACSQETAQTDTRSAPDRRADFDECMRSALDMMVGEWAFQRLMALPNGKFVTVETSSDIIKEHEGAWRLRGFGGVNSSESIALLEYWGEGKYTKRSPGDDVETAFSITYTACEGPDNQGRMTLNGEYDYTVRSIGKTMAVTTTEYINTNGAYIIETYQAKDGSGDTAYRTSLYKPRNPQN